MHTMKINAEVGLHFTLVDFIEILVDDRPRVALRLGSATNSF